MTARWRPALYRARVDLRVQWKRLMVFSLLVGAVTGGVLACLAGARRTDTAFARLRDATAAADVYVGARCGPARCGAGIIEQERVDIETVPGVESAVFVELWDGEFTTADGRQLKDAEDTSSGDLVLVASDDDRWGSSVNDSIVVDGRSAEPTAPNEAVITKDAASVFDLAVGDVIRVVYDLGEGDAAPVRAELLLDLIGIVVDPVGVRPPGGRMYASAIFGTASLARSTDSSNGAFAVTLAPGADAGIFAGTEWEQRVEIDLDENAREINTGTDNDSLVLLIIALVGGAGSLVVLGPVIANAVLRLQADAETLRALGFTRRDSVGRGVMQGAALGACSAVVATAVAVALSPLTPIAEARRFEPDRGVAFDAVVIVPGVLGGALIAFGLVLLAAALRVRLGREPSGRRSHRLRLIGPRRLGPTTSLGERIALGRVNTASSGLGAIIAIALGAAAVIGALTFNAGLNQLRSEPRLVGANFDVALAFAGEEFDPAWADDQVMRLLADPRVVNAVAGTLFPPSPVAVEGHTTWIVSYVPGPRSTPPFVVTDGRAPIAAHELLLHPDLLDDVGAIGDNVPVTIAARPRGESGAPRVFREEFTIVGAGVIPVPDLFERTSAVTLDGLRRLAAGDPELSAGVVPTVVSATYADGLDRDRTTAELVADGVLDDEYVVPPPESGNAAEEVVQLDLAGVERVPKVLALLLGTLGAIVLGLSILDRVAAWRRRIAIHRALGLSSWQTCGAVVIGSVITVALGLVIALPLGIATGRAIWARHAEHLGVVVETPVPGTAIVLASAVAVVVALAAAVRPALAARRPDALRTLRAE